MYIVPDGADPAYRNALDLLIAESGMAVWIWDVANGPMPALPLPKGPLRERGIVGPGYRKMWELPDFQQH
jgi:hypothetical protein